METTLHIKGMACEHCVRHTKEALEAVGGVKSANVNLKNSSALVEHGEEVTLAALKAAVAEAGYEVE